MRQPGYGLRVFGRRYDLEENLGKAQRRRRAVVVVLLLAPARKSGDGIRGRGRLRIDGGGSVLSSVGPRLERLMPSRALDAVFTVELEVAGVGAGPLQRTRGMLLAKAKGSYVERAFPAGGVPVAPPLLGGCGAAEGGRTVPVERGINLRLPRFVSRVQVLGFGWRDRVVRPESS